MLCYEDSFSLVAGSQVYIHCCGDLKLGHYYMYIRFKYLSDSGFVIIIVFVQKRSQSLFILQFTRINRAKGHKNSKPLYDFSCRKKQKLFTLQMQEPNKPTTELTTVYIAFVLNVLQET